MRETFKLCLIEYIYIDLLRQHKMWRTNRNQKTQKYIATSTTAAFR